MSNQYEKICAENQQNFDAENLRLPPDIGNPDPSSPGQVILALAAHNAGGLAQVTFPDLYQAFLTTPLRTGWEWRPSGSGHSASRFGVLDGTKLYGECRHFANALWLLARAPQPFGLGIPHSQVRVDLYDGEYHQGFISNHGHRHLRLSKNVKRPPANRDRLYYWENHKTVLYQTVYYDVCYETIYVARQNMAVYSLTGRYATPPEGNPQFLAEMAKRRSDGLFFWFKRIEPSDHVTNPHRAWLGPIDETTFEVRYRAKGLRMAV